MNIREPEISRALAQMIQSVAFEDRERFLTDAEKAPDLKTFAEGISLYRHIAKL
jgi:hypothetical protein